MQNRQIPVRAICQTAELTAVIGQEIYLLPSGLELTCHIESPICKLHTIEPVEPCLVCLIVHMPLRAVSCIHSIKVDGILKTRHTCDEEFL